MIDKHYPVNGAGLGLRRSFSDELSRHPSPNIDFLEIAPENWMGIGGKIGKSLRYFSERYPMLCHGLSLSIGSPSPLDRQFVAEVGRFLDLHQVVCYSEHLSYCSDDGHLYDLMPIPFTEEAVHYVADRISEVQDILQRQLVIENVSYYAAPGRQLTEPQFINAIVDEADCGLLLDVNNVYVNSVNHGYDALDFIRQIPSARIAYLHIAGHYNEADDLIIDTHGADVIAPVWQLLMDTYQHHGVIPTLLERDFNIPDLSVLLEEVEQIRRHQQSAQAAA